MNVYPRYSLRYAKKENTTQRYQISSTSSSFEEALAFVVPLLFKVSMLSNTLANSALQTTPIRRSYL